MGLVSRKEKAEATKEKIVQEAIQLLSVKGFYHTSLEDLLQATGLSKGGFFNHFKSKEELGFAALDAAFRMWADRYFPAIEAIQDPRERLVAMIDGCVRFAATKPWRGGCFFLALTPEMDDQHEGFRERLQACFDTWEQAIVGTIEEGQAKGVFRKDLDGAAVARFLMAAYEGSVLVAKLHRRVSIFRENMQLVKRVILALVTPRSAVPPHPRDRGHVGSHRRKGGQG